MTTVKHTAKILVTTGPESCGKTTLAAALATHFNCALLPEISREYLNDNLKRKPGFIYSSDDLLAIAALHHRRERALLEIQPEKLVLDTDLLVLLIWYQVRFGEIDRVLVRLFEESLATTDRHYLLCSPDLPWEADSLRENPHDRKWLFGLYRDQLHKLPVSWSIVEGIGDLRLKTALAGAGLQ